MKSSSSVYISELSRLGTIKSFSILSDSKNLKNEKT